MIGKVLTALAILWISPHWISPQAALAQGLPFHTPSALTTAFEQRGLRSFTLLQSRGELTTSVTPLVLLPFAPHQRVTTTLVLPVVWKRLGASGSLPGETLTNGGLGDIRVSVKWAFFVRNRLAGTTRLALVASGIAPTGSTDEMLPTGAVAPRALQLGGGSPGVGASLIGLRLRGRWAITTSAGYSIRGTDKGFKPGSVAHYDVALGFRIPAHIETIRTRTLQMYLEWNGSVTARARNAGATLPDSGGHVAYLSPGLQWVVLPQLLLEGSLQIPVVQALHGTQPRFGVRPGLGLRYLFF